MSLATSLAGAAWLKEPASQAITTMLSDAGHQARFVGGCVRDGLIDEGSSNPDLDITTTALPNDVLAIARRAGKRSIPTGLAHGTVTVFVGKRPFEITTLREDVDTDGRHATVRFTKSFEADAARRDLTFNAMSCSADGTLFDYFGGREDLAAGRVRFVGDPAARIAEDFLRILRYFRFFARFGREEPDGVTQKAITEGVEGMRRLSRERIQKELKGLLLAPNAANALEWMARLNVNQAVFGAEIDVARFAKTDAGGDWIVALAALARGSLEASELADQLRLSGREAQLLDKLSSEELPVANYTDADARRCLFAHDQRTCAGFLRLAHSSERNTDLANALELLNATKDPEFPLKGAHLLELGMEPGPAIGELMSNIERWWIDDGCKAPLAACQAEAQQRLTKARA